MESCIFLQGRSIKSYYIIIKIWYLASPDENHWYLYYFLPSMEPFVASDLEYFFLRNSDLEYLVYCQLQTTERANLIITIVVSNLVAKSVTSFSRK
jgi:hypothetical protein